MMHYDNFEDVMLGLEKKKRTAHLLLGNGFSMAYDPKIFSYNALYDFVTSLKDQLLVAVLQAMKTKNFELMMAQLTTVSAILEALGADQELKAKVRAAHEGLKKSLIDAIKSLHPEHVFKVPEEKSAVCAKFVRRFLDRGGSVFTSNYDLLLYWVLMRQGVPNACDGFGRELLNPVESATGRESQDWSELRWGPNRHEQNIFYLHGALPLFDTLPGCIDRIVRRPPAGPAARFGVRRVRAGPPDFAFVLQTRCTRTEPTSRAASCQSRLASACAWRPRFKRHG